MKLVIMLLNDSGGSISHALTFMVRARTAGLFPSPFGNIIHWPILLSPRRYTDAMGSRESQKGNKVTRPEGCRLYNVYSSLKSSLNSIGSSFLAQLGYKE